MAQSQASSTPDMEILHDIEGDALARRPEYEAPKVADGQPEGFRPEQGHTYGVMAHNAEGQSLAGQHISYEVIEDE